MEDKPKKRGRPKKPVSEEMERIDALLSSLPPHIRRLDATEQSRLNQNLLANEKIEREIYRTYGVGPYVTKNLALEMESLGDEASNGFENEILDQYAEAQGALNESRLRGSATTKTIAHKRAYKVWGKNLDLYEEIVNKLRTPDSAAKVILRRWNVRGDGENPPAINTLKNWLKIIKTDQRLISK